MNNLDYHLEAAKRIKFDNGIMSFVYTNEAPSKVKGKIAGSPDKQGYLHVGISLNGKLKRLKLHRVAFLKFHGYLPEIVDHIDGDITNNSIENLRESSHKDNRHNQKSRSGSTSKFYGVNLDTRANSWISDIKDGGSRYAKRCHPSEFDAAVEVNRISLKLGRSQFRFSKFSKRELEIMTPKNKRLCLRMNWVK